MKALTIPQPWASLIACGAKKIETRSWATKYRGTIAIHAGKGIDIDACHRDPICSALLDNDIVLTNDLPQGQIIAIADLVDCFKINGRVSLKIGDEKRVAAVLENGVCVTGNELAFGDYTLYRDAWILENVRRIEPVPANGMQRLWEWKDGGLDA